MNVKFQPGLAGLKDHPALRSGLAGLKDHPDLQTGLEALLPRIDLFELNAELSPPILLIYLMVGLGGDDRQLKALLRKGDIEGRTPTISTKAKESDLKITFSGRLTLTPAELIEFGDICREPETSFTKEQQESMEYTWGDLTRSGYRHAHDGHNSKLKDIKKVFEPYTHVKLRHFNLIERQRPKTTADIKSVLEELADDLDRLEREISAHTLTELKHLIREGRAQSSRDLPYRDDLTGTVNLGSFSQPHVSRKYAFPYSVNGKLTFKPEKWRCPDHGTKLIHLDKDTPKDKFKSVRGPCPVCKSTTSLEMMKSNRGGWVLRYYDDYSCPRCTGGSPLKPPTDKDGPTGYCSTCGDYVSSVPPIAPKKKIARYVCVGSVDETEHEPVFEDLSTEIEFDRSKELWNPEEEIETPLSPPEDVDSSEDQIGDECSDEDYTNGLLEFIAAQPMRKDKKRNLLLVLKNSGTNRLDLKLDLSRPTIAAQRNNIKSVIRLYHETVLSWLWAEIDWWDTGKPSTEQRYSSTTGLFPNYDRREWKVGVKWLEADPPGPPWWNCPVIGIDTYTTRLPGFKINRDKELYKARTKWNVEITWPWSFPEPPENPPYEAPKDPPTMQPDELVKHRGQVLFGKDGWKPIGATMPGEIVFDTPFTRGKSTWGPNIPCRG